MIIGLDTNILVRYLTDDDSTQADKVQQFFDSHKENATFLINHVVLAELDWVLTHVYNYTRQEFLMVIDQIFQTKYISFQNPAVVNKACSAYVKSKADFSDCYIGVLNEMKGCNTSYTFDKKASNLTLFTLLQ